MRKVINNGRRDVEADEPEEGFYARWSRRKSALEPRQADADGVGEERGAGDRERDAGAAAPGAEADAAPVKTDADMPPLESLDEESDYTGFLSPGVSEDLRRMALRRLFRLPQFNIRDGLNDYDEDFRIFEPLGKIVTADMKYHAERQAAKARELLVDDADAETRTEAPLAAQTEAAGAPQDVVADAGDAEDQAVDADREGGERGDDDEPESGTREHG